MFTNEIYLIRIYAFHRFFPMSKNGNIKNILSLYLYIGTSETC